MTPPTQNDPSVLVIVVNFNGGGLLHACLDSLQGQRFRDFRTVVVDNASTDGSADALEQRFPGVSVIRSPRNLGFAAGNNLAVREAGSARWIALLNPDAVARPEWLEQLMAAAHAHPQFSLFSSRLLADEAGTVLDGAGDAYHLWGIPWRVGHGQPAPGAYLEAREIFAPCAAAALYRREVFEDTGGFDEDFFCYVEDVDLAFRARLLGHRTLYVPESIAVHVGSGVVGRHSDFQIYHGHRNLVWTWVRNMPALLLWLYLPAHLALTLVSLAVFALRGRGAPIWRAKRDAWRGLPRAWAKRQATQASRTASIGELLALMQEGFPKRYSERSRAARRPVAPQPAYSGSDPLDPDKT